jgi:prefoldin subunit 5
MPGAVAPMVAEPPIESQTQMLKAQAEQMEKSLDQIRKRIAELETTQSKEG